MNKNLFELLNAVKLVDVVVTSALFIALVAIIATQRDKIKEVFEAWRKKKNFEENAVTLISKNQKKIDYLEETMTRARQQSIEIRAKMYDDLGEVKGNVKQIITTLDSMQMREKASKRADIKEKIERIYRECNEAQKITDMQYETLKELIEDYERHGGKNSFIHSVVQNEMYDWEIIKKIPDNGGGSNGI